MFIVKIGIPHIFIEADMEVIYIAAGNLAQRLERHPTAVTLDAIGERIRIKCAIFLKCATEALFRLEPENAERHVRIIALRRS